MLGTLAERLSRDKGRGYSPGERAKVVEKRTKRKEERNGRGQGSLFPQHVGVPNVVTHLDFWSVNLAR